MGVFVCIAFVWNRKGFSLRAFFKKKTDFENPTELDLKEFNYYN